MRMKKSIDENLIKRFGKGWYDLLEDILVSDYFKEIGRALISSKKIYYPGKKDIFRAFELCPVEKLKVVILGQDPYHDGSATGLAFSNRSDSKSISPSLRNILKEVEDSVYDGFKLEQDPNLERWAEQGVLLLNTALTVEKSNPGSHAELWDEFTRKVIKRISDEIPAIVYMLWGKHAKGYLEYISRETNFILASPHPSPFSAGRGFFGNKHFSKCNEVLVQVGIAKEEKDYEIKW